MAYPDYSIVIISVTENGVTNDYAHSFFNDELAKKFYNQAVSEGKRAFYYEKPKATRFVRNDTQPLKVNTEKGLESQPIQSIELEEEEESTEEFIEDVVRNAEAVFTDAFGLVKSVVKFELIFYKKAYKIFLVGPFKFTKKVFDRFIYEPAGVIGFEIVSNKKIIWSYDGQGGVIITIEKLWYDKDEVSWNPPLDQNPTLVITEIEGVDVTLGTKRFKWVHDGTPTGGPVTEEYTWIPAGNVIYTSFASSTEYISSGNGFYTSRDITNTNCDPIGTVYSQVSQNDIMFNLMNAGGPDLEVKIGDVFVELVADGNCEEVQASRNAYISAGYNLYEDGSYVYQTLGNGGVIQRPRMTQELINYQSPCGPMQVGVIERYFDGTQGENITYVPYGSEVGRCQGLIYFSLGNGEVYTEVEPEQPPPPPPEEDQWFYDPSEGTNWDGDETGKDFTVSFIYEYGALFNGLGVEYDAYYDFGSGTWIQNTDPTIA